MGTKLTLIKTGISVFIAIAISKLLNLKYPFFVTLPVMVPIQDTFLSAVMSGKNRMIGTAIGALTGIVFVFIKPESAVLCGIGIAVIIYLCTRLKLNQSEAIAGIVFISIMVSLKGENPYRYSLNRVLDTLLGVCITIAVNYFITSKYNKTAVLKNMDRFHEEFLNYVREMVCFYNYTNLNNMNNKIRDMDEQLHKLSDESKLRSKNTPKLAEAMGLLDIYENTYEHLKMISSLKYRYPLNKANYEKLESIFREVDSNTGQYADTAIYTVFNYHVSKIIENIDNARKKITDLLSAK